MGSWLDMVSNRNHTDMINYTDDVREDAASDMYIHPYDTGTANCC